MQLQDRRGARGEEKKITSITEEDNTERNGQRNPKRIGLILSLCGALTSTVDVRGFSETVSNFHVHEYVLRHWFDGGERLVAGRNNVILDLRRKKHCDI